MRYHLLILTLIASAPACSSGNLRGTGGAAGTSGTGGGGSGGTSTGGRGGDTGSRGGDGDGDVGGRGGTAALGGRGGGADLGGRGGAAGSYEACGVLASADVAGTIDASASVNATVTVASINSDATQIVLASSTSSQRWTWSLKIPNMPADLIKAGDTFDLTATIEDIAYAFAPYRLQTVVLARGGALVAFTANLFGGAPALPALDAWGITVTDNGVLCDVTAPFCGHRLHSVAVNVGGNSIGGFTSSIWPGQTVRLQDLSFSVSKYETPFDYQGGCDAPPVTLMAGFRQPSTGGTGGMGGTDAPGTAGAGSAGAAGTAGSSGGAGAVGGAGGATGGTAGQCVVSSSPDRVEIAIVGADGLPVATAVSAPVTVTSIADCTPATCPQSCLSSICLAAPSAAASRITLTNGAQPWTLYLRDSAMPPDLIRVGDAFDLAVDAEMITGYVNAVNQTVTLSRGGQLLVFASRIKKLGLPMPDLHAVGVTIADGGIPCGRQDGCGTFLHDALVTIGSETQRIGNGVTSTVGGLSFTNGAFSSEGVGTFCGDPMPTQTLMAGFRRP
jgi:hypothetical protein